ncbi:MAG: hypothetical protein E7396_03465 [Ruminococcaceae bacterium]|nr:hypothetical protein [Oscillospiraceae bacterium]
MKDIIIHLIFTLSATTLPLIAGWILSFVCFSNDKHFIKEKLENDTELSRTYHRFYVWYKSTILWTITEYLFVIIPFISNVIVIYLSNIKDIASNTPVILFHSIISLSFIVFGFAINPQRQKKCYRKAFTHLDSCINEYLSNPKPDILRKGLKDGEKFIDPSCDIE